MSGAKQIGIVGFGKIARDQHVPAIAACDEFELIAVTSHHTPDTELPAYSDVSQMLEAHPEMDAVVVCTPPQARFTIAAEALSAGKHVFLEKPPGVGLSEVDALVVLAQRSGVSLFAGWHSRFARHVAETKSWIAEREVEKIAIIWKEDVRQWHPGQTWIWEAGGFGVFDPGINALSILTEILAEPVRLIEATLEIPSNCQAPIAAQLELMTASGAPILAEFDFRQIGAQSWDIMIDASGQQVCLGHGGNSLRRHDGSTSQDVDGEYPAMYKRFAGLMHDGAIEVDTRPLQLVADAFLRGQMRSTLPFNE